MRVVLSHMVVKLCYEAKTPLISLRVVLSHMVVKPVLSYNEPAQRLRVVLSHMVVKQMRKIYVRIRLFESSVISYGSQTILVIRN